jgi:mRNA interferase MazF
MTINSSRVIRGTHPYIIWMSDEVMVHSLQTFVVIPLTSKDTYIGLPTTYPIRMDSKNGLEKKSYALVHQITTIDANCLKDANGKWLGKRGVLGTDDRKEIRNRLRYSLSLSTDLSEDWFAANASQELIQNLFERLPADEQDDLLDKLINLR